MRPDGLALDDAGNLWGADLDANAVIHVDLATGDQSLLADDFIADFSGYERMPLELGPDGNLYVARLGAITRVDPTTGAKTVLYDQTFVLAWARGIAFDTSGRLWVTASALSSFEGALLRFDSVSDTIPDILCHQRISGIDPCSRFPSGGWSDPRDLVVDPENGHLVSAFVGSGGVARLDRATGEAFPLPSLGADGLAPAFGGFYATASSGGDEIYHVDRVTGAVTVVSPADQIASRPWDIEVAPVTVVPERGSTPGLLAGGVLLSGLRRSRTS